jgi:hypothetical protein
MPSDDFVARLRRYDQVGPKTIITEAADEIERLQKENNEFRALISDMNRTPDRVTVLCGRRYDRLQAIREIVGKHDLPAAVRDAILHHTDTLD